jgi:adenosylcobinamide-phosphate synthase
VIAAAVAIDLLGGELPDALHPVAWLGRGIVLLETRLFADEQGPRLLQGAALTGLLVGGAALVGAMSRRLLGRLAPVVRIGCEALLLKQSFSLSGLAAAAEETRRCLERDDLVAARRSLRALVSRQVADLDASGAASAAIESVAENLPDSLVAPLLYYRWLGLPGAFAYRAANTLDAMIGYHGRYERFGKPAARLDDALSFVPARISAVLIVLAAGLGSGRWREAGRVLMTQNRRTESPNAGWPMSAAAGALGVRLEKRGHYVLGESFGPPRSGDIKRAVQLYRVAGGLWVVIAVLFGRRRSTIGLRAGQRGGAGR